jgi:preprotein translocase subunit YajC
MQYSQLAFLAVVAVVFYLFVIRPQQQQAKRQQEMIASLQPGDSIVTIGGIFATIVSVNEDRLRVAVADGSELEIASRAVSAVVEGDTDGLPEDEGSEDESVDETDDETAGPEDSSK